MYRCSLTGFFSNTNGAMVYDENKTVILNINTPDNLTGAGLAGYFMGKLFSPREPIGDLPVRVHWVGEIRADSNDTVAFAFCQKNDPGLTSLLNNGGSIIESNAPMSFKINKLTNEQQQADEFSSVPYLDVYDALIDFTDDKSTQFESLGYALPKVDNQQIVFHSLAAVSMPMLYPSGIVFPDEIPPVSREGAGTYVIFEPLTTYDDSVNTSGELRIVDAVKQTGKRYYFDNFTEFFDDKWVRDTIAANHQSLVISEISGSGGYLIGLYGTETPTGESVNATKISIELNNPAVKLIAAENSSITGSGTNVISVCLNPNNIRPL